LKNAAFSFDFGAAPLPPPRSSRKTPRPSPAQTSRKTPQSALAQRPSTRKTPAGSGAKPASASRTNQKSASVAPSSGSRDSDSNGQTFKTPVATGKRKRHGQLAAVEETEQDELEPTPEDIIASRPMTIRQSIEVSLSAQKTPATIPLGTDQDDEPDELSPEQDGPAIKNPVREIQTPTLLRRLSERRGRSRSRQSVGSAESRGSVILSIEEDEIEEDELSFLQEPGTTVEVQTSSGKRNSSSGLAMATSTSDALNVSLTAPNNQSTRREMFGPSELEEPFVEPLPAVEDADEDELSPEQAKRPQKSRAPARKPPIVESGAVEDDISEDELSPARLKKRRRSGKAPIEVHQDEAENEVSEIDELSPQQPRVIQHKKPRQPLSTSTTNIPKKPKKTKRTERATSPPRKKAKTTGGGVIGITIYRRTESTNIAYDSLGSDPNPGITPADVLAQVSGELATNHIAALSQQARPSNVSKKTRKRQIGAMTYFRDLLADSLFELQSAHLSAHVLASQLRAAGRRKRNLREELMVKRREREELDLEIDRVRAKHREKMEKEDRHFSLVQNLRDIELAVRKGREKAKEEEREEEPEVGVEMLVGSVMESVGLLGRVREWNGMLEESAAVLEARA
jgi:hypothetical protein